MPKNVLIKGGRVIDPAEGVDEKADLLCSDGQVAHLGARSETEAELVINAEGMMVCPAFVDMHVHLREPGDVESETVATGTAAAARGGFGTVCAMANTTPAIDSPEMAREARRNAGNASARVLQIATITKGRAGRELVDFEALAEEGVIAFSDDGAPVADPDLMEEAMRRVSKLGSLIINHADDPAALACGAVNAGATAQRLGLESMPPEGEAQMVKRDLALAARTGCRIHVPHVSTAAAIEYISRAVKVGVPVSAEVTPHHLFNTDQEVELNSVNARVNPPLRSEEDRRAVLNALAEGVLEVIATDHAPHSASKKGALLAKAAPGISGLETAFGQCAQLVHSGILDWSGLITRMSVNPARIVGRPELGTLRSGTPADAVIFDPDKEWRVDPNEFASLGRNTLLAGSKLKGRVVATIQGGRVRYRGSIECERVTTTAS